LARLYHRAIIESGSFAPSMAKTLLSAELLFAKYTSVLNCPSEGDAAVDCLNRQSTTRLCLSLQYLPPCCDFTNIFLPWAPVVDGTELPLHPWEAVGGGMGTGLHVDDDLPVLHGTVRDEGSYYFETAPPNLNLPGLIARWSANFGPDVVDALKDIYLPTQSPDVFHSNFYFADSRTLGDFWATCSAWRTSHRQSTLSRPVWEYQFQAVDPYSFHGTEIPFVFQHQFSMERGSEAARELSIKIANYWATFADTGDPNSVETPLWPRFDATVEGGGSLLTLDLKGTQGHQTSGLLTERCGFWIPYLEAVMRECKETFPCGNKRNIKDQVPITLQERIQEGREPRISLSEAHSQENSKNALV
jgi:para-nitrobenzyl esterase